MAAATAGDVDHRRLVDDVDPDARQRVAEDRRPEVARRAAGGGDDDRRGEHRDDDGDERREQRHADGSKANGAFMRASPPVIAAPRSCGVTSAGSNVPTRRPRRMTSMGSDRPISSSRSAEISSTARPSRRARLMCSQMAACAPTSTPRVGMGRDQEDRVAAHLASDDELLLVAAGQRPGGHVDARRADVVLLDDALGVLAGTGPVDPRALGARRPRLVAEDAVLPERRVEQQAVPVAVLGDVADAGLAQLAGVPAVTSRSPRRTCRTWGCACP